MVFVDLEKAYDRVPGKLTWLSLRKKRVPEAYIKIVQAMYENCQTQVTTREENTEYFDMKVGLHQGSASSPLLFIIIMADTTVKTAKRRAADATLDNVSIGDNVLENVLNFEYLGSRLQCDADDQGDVRHRMDIAQATFGSLSHLWSDHRLSRETKL